MKKNEQPKFWVSYLRVSTLEQADREISLANQRRAIEAYAARHGRTILREYVDAGRSGASENRPAYQQMLSDVFASKGQIDGILVYHTSRFGRNSIHARVAKVKLRRLGVRVLAVCQETTDDVTGRLHEHIHEDFDEYESEINGLRTSAALAEVARQGFFPAPKAPFGFEKKRIEIKAGMFRSILAVYEPEASIVREIFQLYLANNGAKAVARILNQGGRLCREGILWSKERVLAVLDNHAAIGCYYWRKFDAKNGVRRDESEWIAIRVEALVDASVFDVAAKLRRERDPQDLPGSPSSVDRLLYKLVRCAQCGASYQLETSGKLRPNGLYQYRYYNCRRSCRVGSEACRGGRIPVSRLDALVLRYLVDTVCSPARCEALVAELERGLVAQRHQKKVAQLRAGLADIQERIESCELMLRFDDAKREFGKDRMRELKGYETNLRAMLEAAEVEAAQSVVLSDDAKDRVAPTFALAWRNLVAHDSHVARNYLHHVVQWVEVNGPEEIRVVPRADFVGAEEVIYRDPIESPASTTELIPGETAAERQARRFREFKLLEEQGATRAEIARMFGVSRAWVTQVLGPAPRRGPTTKKTTHRLTAAGLR